MHATYSDVLIIGQGVIGASIAYHAVQHGWRIISVERAAVAVDPAVVATFCTGACS